MRYVEKILESETLKRNAEADARLDTYLAQELSDAFAAQHDYEEAICEALRQYHAVPEQPIKSVPIENAPNIEVPLGAIATDALYAQAISAIFNTSPIVTARAVHEEYIEHAKGLQQFIDWGVENEWGLREAAEHAILDCVQLGTGAFIVPYEEGIRKTKTRRVLERGPRIHAVAPEDLIMQGGAIQDTERMPWVGVQMWMTGAELNQYAKVKKTVEDHEGPDDPRRWDVELAKPCGTISRTREMREFYARTEENAKQRDLYRIVKVYLSFDYDNDGEDEEMIAIFDVTAQKCLWRGWTPHGRRPTVKFVFQVLGHLPRGLGVMEMLQPFQAEVTMAHNDRSLNVKLANVRIFKTRQGSGVDEATLAMWENRVVQVTSMDDLQEMILSEVHPSAVQHQAVTMALAERRVGVSDLNAPAGQQLNSRTPAYTASVAQQTQFNRFTPAYDAIRFGCADAVKQCLWRYHERLLTEPANGPAAMNIMAVCGKELGPLVIECLEKDNFLESVAVSLTATNAQTNRDAERQNMVMLVNLLKPYYESLVPMVQLASTPGTPPAMISALTKIADAAAEMIERTVRTFDSVRDPNRIAVNVTGDLQAAAQAALGGLGGQMGQIAGPAAPNDSTQEADGGTAGRTTEGQRGPARRAEAGSTRPPRKSTEANG